MSAPLGNGDGTFAAAQNVNAGTRPYSAAMADVNGDGVLALITASDAASGTVSVLRGNRRK